MGSNSPCSLWFSSIWSQYVASILYRDHWEKFPTSLSSLSSLSLSSHSLSLSSHSLSLSLSSLSLSSLSLSLEWQSAHHYYPTRQPLLSFSPVSEAVTYLSSCGHFWLPQRVYCLIYVEKKKNGDLKTFTFASTFLVKLPGGIYCPSSFTWLHLWKKIWWGVGANLEQVREWKYRKLTTLKANDKNTHTHTTQNTPRDWTNSAFYPDQHAAHFWSKT